MKKGKKKTQNWWKCSSCGFTVQLAEPPEKCPGCKQICTFIDVTCYTPECGGPGNINKTLMGRGKQGV